MRAVTHLFEYMKFKFSFPPVFSRGLFADNYFWLIFFTNVTITMAQSRRLSSLQFAANPMAACAREARGGSTSDTWAGGFAWKGAVGVDCEAPPAWGSRLASCGPLSFLNIMKAYEAQRVDVVIRLPWQRTDRGRVCVCGYGGSEVKGTAQGWMVGIAPKLTWLCW